MAADPTPSSRPRIARFGVFEVDLASGELRRDGIRVPIQDQPARILGYLLERAGEVVTRDDLREHLWPAEFVDFDHSLNTAIRKLRAALDDTADNPRFIETLARRGYRFIAPVSWAGQELHEATPFVPKPSINRAAIATVAIVAIAMFAAAIFFFQRSTPAPQAIDSIAVLPFKNADPASQHINDGLTEMLIDSMSHLPQLRVMAPTTVFRYKDVDPKRAGKDLGVSAVVTGRIRRDNDHYGLRVEMIDVRDGAQVWSARYDATPSELPSVQTRIADDLASQLRRGVHATSHPYTTNPEAYELYTKGLYAWNQRGRDDLNRALEYFNAAAAKDPNFAAAYSGLAKTYGVMVGFGLLPVPEGTTKVVANAQKALDIDPNNAEALVSLASTKYRNLWDFAGADADYRRALELDPNYATGHEWYSDLLRTMGKWDAARSEIELAYKLDPFSGPINIMRSCHYFYERRYREAIAVSRKAGELDPRFDASFCVMASFLALGDVESAAKEMRRCRFVTNHNRIADAFQSGGREAFLRTWEQELETGIAQTGDQSVGIAMLYAQLGDHDRAFEWLEKACDRRVSRLTNINIEPGLDPLHSDPRWDPLLKRIGLPKVQPPKS